MSDERFVHKLYGMPPGSVVVEPYPDLPPDEQRKVDERLAELRLARLRAEISGRDYLITGSTT